MFQLVPYFVLDEMSYLPGLPGLFVACIMSGALSTVSSGLNSLAAVTWQDFISNIPMFQKMSEEKQSWVLRATSKQNIEFMQIYMHMNAVIAGSHRNTYNSDSDR